MLIGWNAARLTRSILVHGRCPRMRKLSTHAQAGRGRKPDEILKIVVIHPKNFADGMGGEHL
jgi:hypothetical protein